jgi:DegV family protein with EDD domain
MGRIGFITDSTAGLPADQVQKYNVEVVPLQVIFGTETFRDGIDLTQDEFFERLKAAKTLPTTSQPTTGDIEAAYTRLLNDPEVDSIIAVHISSLLSGTHSAATQALERLKADTGNTKKVTIIDSYTVYMCEGLMVMNGARAAAEGKSHDEVVALIEAVKPRTQLLVIIDTLEYLARGGRIGGARALLGGLLKVKPILHIKDGRVEPLEQVRTRRRAMERAVELGAEFTKGKPCQIAVGHAQAPEDAETLSRMVHEKMNVVEEFHSDLGPVISTHTGPGVLGFVYCPLE